MAELCEFALQQMVWELCGDCSGGELIASPADYKTRGVAVDITLCEEPLDVSAHHVYLIWRHRQARKRGCEELFAMDAAAGRKAVYWPRAMACIEGVVECQLVLSYADGGSMTSRTFLVRVQEELIGSVDPGDGFTLFVDVIKRYENATADLLGVAEQLRAEAAEGGFKGDPGEPGKDGAPGRDGVDGKDGAPGRDGEPGPAGAPGRDGADGAPGKDGAPGRDGADGKPGEPGRDGADGKDGASPNVTIETVDGVPVMKVECGGVVTQATVLQGPKGDAGEPGAKGERGEKGYSGVDGKDGASPNVIIETAADGTALMKVECNGVVTQATVLQGPKGDAGDPGEKGEKGDPGEKGEKGDPGGDPDRPTTRIKCYKWFPNVYSFKSDPNFDFDDDEEAYEWRATFNSYTILALHDYYIDYDHNLLEIVGVKRHKSDPNAWEYDSRIVGSLRGAKLVLMKGIDIEPGVSSKDYIEIEPTIVREGDYILSVDTGCMSFVESVRSDSDYETGIMITGVSKLGAPDMTTYATKAYVDEKITAAIPADLSEVSF